MLTEDRPQCAGFTAVAETEDGLFEIIRWSPHRTSRVEIPVEEFEAAA